MRQVTLRELVVSERLASTQEMTYFALGLASAISASHRSGVLVGTVGPDDVILTDANVVQLSSARTGRDSWMPPEVRSGSGAGILGDSYLWGTCVAFAASRGKAMSMQSLVATMPRALGDLVERSLSMTPEIRPGLDEIVSILSGNPAPGLSTSAREQRSSALVWILTGAVVAAVLGVAAVVVLVGRTTTNSPPPSLASESVEPDRVSTAQPADPTSEPASPVTPTPKQPPVIDPRPQPPPGPAVVAASGTSFLEGRGSPVRCAYFPEGTAGQVIACIDDQSETLVRLNAGMIRVTRVTADQSAQVPRTGVVLAPGGSARLYGTKGGGKSLFECWGVPDGVACQELEEGDWFVMTGGSLRTS